MIFPASHQLKPGNLCRTATAPELREAIVKNLGRGEPAHLSDRDFGNSRDIIVSSTNLMHPTC